jgi:hypothetical protein
METRTTTEELIRNRIDSATTSTNKWNSWPDQLEIVRIEEVDVRDPYAAYTMGYTMAKAPAMRQIDEKNIPMEIRTALRKKLAGGWIDRLYRLETAHFGLATPVGQVDPAETRNIVIIFEPRKKYIYGKNGPGSYEFETAGVIVEVGCKHEYDDAGSNHRRGYHKGRCTRCGHAFMCDSGD